MDRENLYQQKIRFRLVCDSKKVKFDKIVSEPINVRDAQYVINRDEKFWGFSSQYLDDEFTLRFDNTIDSGRKDIESVVKEYGFEASVLFHIEINESAVWKDLFLGQLNLSTLKREVEYITCSIENRNVYNLLRTRFETPVLSDASKTLDNEAKEPIPASNIIDVYVQGQPIRKAATGKIEVISEKASQGNAQMTPPTIMIDYLGVNEVVSDFDGFSDTGNSFTKTTHTPKEEVITSLSRPLFTAKEGGSMEVSADFKINLGLNLSFSVMPQENSKQIEILLDVFRCTEDNVFIEKRTLKSLVVDALLAENVQMPDLYYIYKFNGENTKVSLSVNKNDKVFVVFYYRFIGAYSEQIMLNGFRGMVNPYEGDIKIKQIEQTPHTKVKAIRLPYLLKSNIEAVTNTNLIQSDYLFKVGIQDVFVTNGFNLRGVDRPVKSTLKDLFEVIRSQFCLGYTLTESEQGEPYLRFEPFGFFFKDSQILELPFIADYSEEYEKKLLFNEFEIGYAKFVEDDKLGQDAFNTIRRYLMPNKTVKNLYSAKCPYVADGYLIEQARVKQFAEKEIASANEDDLNFLLCASSTYNYDLGKNVNTTDDFTNLDILKGTFEGNRPINLRISPARMMKRWSNFINSALSFDENEEAIKLTDSKGNIKLESSYRAEFSELQSTEIIKEGSNEQENLSYALFKPVLCSFKAPLTYSGFMLIRESLLLRNKETENGYITINSPFGKEDIFIKTLKYNPIEEIAEITGWKKVKQDSDLTKFSVNPNVIELSNTVGDIFEVEIDSSEDWKIYSVPGEQFSWCFFAPFNAKSGKKIARVYVREENNSTQERKAVLNFRLKNGTTNKTLTIIQKPKEIHFAVEPEILEVSNNINEKFYFQVDSSESWKLKYLSPTTVYWIELDDEESFPGKKNINVIVRRENETDEVRDFKLGFTLSNGATEKTVTIIQKPKEIIVKHFMVDPEILNVSNTFGEKFEFKVNSNQNWQIEDFSYLNIPDWFFIKKEKEEGTETTFSINVLEPNKTDEERSYVLKFEVDGEISDKTLTIVQKPAEDEDFDIIQQDLSSQTIIQQDLNSKTIIQQKIK